MAGGGQGTLRKNPHHDAQDEMAVQSLVGPSAIVADAVVGLFLGGQILSAMAGFLGSAQHAVGRTGDVARAMGETVIYIQAQGHQVIQGARRLAVDRPYW
jgi:hypothetical protein